MPSISAEQGAILIEADERRWWFDITDDENLVLAAAVSGEPPNRTYEKPTSLPDPVADAIEADGYDGEVYDVDGRPL